VGKKKNKKLKRILRAQALVNAPQAATIAPESAQSGEAVAAPAISKHEAEVIQLSEDKKDVRHEIKKILITIAVLVLIIIAVDLVNNKTDMILKTGQFIAEKLNLNL
jgi:hypothetical protein